MPGLIVYSGNRLEVLVEKLAGVIRQPSGSVIAPEVIVVQSRGMARWLSFQLASRNGISANCTFPFPNAFLQMLCSQIFADMDDANAYDRENLTFRIMALLPELLDQKGFEAPREYLTADPLGLKRYQLSLKIADTLDQYLVFRPGMISAWEKGEDTHWQAVLWRRLTSGIETPHRARLQKDLLGKLRTGGLDNKIDPGRVSLFGISYLPPFHLHAFAAISALLEVNLFILNPCMAYWADIVSEGEIRRIQKRYTATGAGVDSLHLDKGNPLLASMGTQGRDFFTLINGIDAEFDEYFLESDGDGLLPSLQRDILFLVDRGGARGPETTFKKVPVSDRSIQIHSCHSPMREVEVLYDNLLAMFDEDPGLEPGDVFVMTPDMETYAPFIQGVFDTQPEEHLRIPFSITDQAAGMEYPLLEGFFRLLEMKEGRLGVRQVMALLEAPGVMKRFGITIPDLPMVERWLKDTRICWGRDEMTRLESGVPGFRHNTWRFGMDRLLLGVALPGSNRRLFSGILPYDHIEGRNTAVLGYFLDFLEWMFSSVEMMGRKRSLVEWSRWINRIIGELYDSNEEMESQLQMLRDASVELKRIQEVSRFEESVEVEVIRSVILEHLQRKRSGGGFIGGGVTFCAMLPMRSIPSKVICMIGMNGDAFPRDNRDVGFDLVSRFPKAGDRSRRNDDKYLFLEAIISARSILYVSYTGQSIRDNTPKPPSVLVSELLDYLMEGFGVSEDRLVTRHRLQAFSPAYFKGEKALFSYSKEDCHAAENLWATRRRPIFIKEKLPVPPESCKDLSLESLCRFFSHPVKYFFQQRLGLFLDDPLPGLEEREAFALDPLERYLIGHEMHQSGLAGENWPESYRMINAAGALPMGNVGEVRFREMDSELFDFLKKKEKLRVEKEIDPMEIDLRIDGFRLTGKIDGRVPNGFFRSRFAKTRSKDMLCTWITHLALCSSTPPEDSVQSVFVGKDLLLTFLPVQESRKLLGALLSLYWMGLSEPVPLFPSTSLFYARKRFRLKKSRSVALTAARYRWSGTDFSMGECNDPYHARCFGETDPICDTFVEVTEAVYAPLMASCVEEAI